MEKSIKYIILGVLILGAIFLASCNQRTSNASGVLVIDELGQAISLKGRELFKLAEVKPEYKIGDIVEVLETKEDNQISTGEVTKNITRSLLDINLVSDILKENHDIILIDVRTIEEYNSGHLIYSINYPVDNINANSSLAWDQDTTLIVYCRSGNRSARAAKMLNNLGYKLVLDAGGVNSFHGDLVK